MGTGRLGPLVVALSARKPAGGGPTGVLAVASREWLGAGAAKDAETLSSLAGTDEKMLLADMRRRSVHTHKHTHGHTHTDTHTHTHYVCWLISVLCTTQPLTSPERSSQTHTERVHILLVLYRSLFHITWTTIYPFSTLTMLVALHGVSLAGGYPPDVSDLAEPG